MLSSLEKPKKLKVGLLALLDFRKLPTEEWATYESLIVPRKGSTVSANAKNMEV